MHEYDDHGINPARRELFYRGAVNTTEFYRGSIDSGTWTAIPNNLLEYPSCCAGVEYFPELGGVDVGARR